jgi:hypothetical protein
MHIWLENLLWVLFYNEYSNNDQCHRTPTYSKNTRNFNMQRKGKEILRSE